MSGMAVKYLREWTVSMKHFNRIVVALAMAFGIAPNEVEPAPAYEMMII